MRVGWWRGRSDCRLSYHFSLPAHIARQSSQQPISVCILPCSHTVSSECHCNQYRYKQKESLSVRLFVKNQINSVQEPKGPFTPSASTSIYAHLRASTDVDGRRRARCEWALRQNAQAEFTIGLHKASQDFCCGGALYYRLK